MGVAPHHTAVEVLPFRGWDLAELMSRAGEKTYKKGKRNGSIFRAERVDTIHQMTTEEARTTEVNITKTEKGSYGNAHIRYDINDGLVDVVLEVIPTEEQKAERARKQNERKDQRKMSKEEEHEIKEKYRVQTTKRRRRIKNAHTTAEQRKVVRTARAKSS
jgi:hypothetical protein